MDIKPSGVEHTTILKWLDKLLASPAFATSRKHQKFLRYLVEQTLNGHGDRIKGYSIGVEALGRPPQFDPNHDAIVRVEANRLRTKLCEYYQNLGAQDAIHFHLRKGSYQVVFHNPMHPALHNNRDETLHPRLIVIPLTSSGPNPAHKYFADGLTDGIISSLHKLRHLSVLPWEVSFKYYDTAKSHLEIANEVNASYLLEGNTETVGNKVHISIRVGNVKTSTCLWSKDYHVETSSLAMILHDIVCNVESKLEQANTLSGRRQHNDRRIASALVSPPTSPANIAFLHGLEQFEKNTRNSIAAAKQLFLLALEYDANYAPTHAWIARTLAYQWVMLWEEGDEIINLAQQHAVTALKINPELSIINTVYGWIALCQRNGEQAITYCQNSVNLDPNSLDAHFFLAMCYCSCGNGVAALEHIKRAMQLSSTHTPLQFYILGHAYFALGNYDEAFYAWNMGCDISKNFMPNHFYLCLLLSMQGEKEKSEEKRRQVIAFTGHNYPPIRTFWLDADLAKKHEELTYQAGFSMRNS